MPFFGCTGVRPQWIRSNQRCPTYTKLGDDTSTRKTLLFFIHFLWCWFVIFFKTRSLKPVLCTQSTPWSRLVSFPCPYKFSIFQPLQPQNSCLWCAIMSESTRKAKVYITAWNRSFGQTGRWPTTNSASARVLAVWVSAVVVHGYRQWGDLRRRRRRQRRVPWTTYDEMKVSE